MWPFRKKPEPKPYRWHVEERLERQVMAALQREHWKSAAPLIAEQRRALEALKMRQATQAEMNAMAYQTAQAAMGSQHGWMAVGIGIRQGAVWR